LLIWFVAPHESVATDYAGQDAASNFFLLIFPALEKPEHPRRSGLVNLAVVKVIGSGLLHPYPLHLLLAPNLEFFHALGFEMLAVGIGNI
jgi:hypothetical protein